MNEQTAQDMRNIADTANENDVSSWLAGSLKEIKERAEQGYYSVEISFPEESNDRHSLICKLERRGFKVSDYNQYVQKATVAWS